MRLIIGIDEAGYGPNLGPLVIGASVWLSETKLNVCNWSVSLHPVFANRAVGVDEAAIALGDSKIIYSAKKDLANLSRTIAFFSKQAGLTNKDSAHLICDLDADFEVQTDIAPWLKFDVAADSETLTCTDPIVRTAGEDKLAKSGLKLFNLKTRIISEPIFNEQVERLGNKANLLTSESICLAKNLLAETLSLLNSKNVNVQSVEIYFDKHGGRSKYLPALLSGWNESMITIDIEKPSLSRYNLHGFGYPVQVEFVAKGDSLVPCGLASILAKWAREILMQRLNRFWQAKQPGLKPTAGYPLDARRFAQDIAFAAEQSDLPKQLWWRTV